MTPIFIGDETSAAGYRLAGLRTRSPRADEVLEVFRWACAETDLLLLGVAQARQLPAEELADALHRLQPQILIVPDIQQQIPMRDLPVRIRTQLGMKV
ncbi:V-type ATP synthase subunit F [Sulfurivermis fontis]|uniref:V-type ATP synthase subunit F n=1 Tax=Sulfurivermis fontis TaxID=1972068 RepID=UPI000FDB7137|nr:V-type ATP synthase subunit F [Sulfurivermis fontis]